MRLLSWAFASLLCCASAAYSIDNPTAEADTGINNPDAEADTDWVSSGDSTELPYVHPDYDTDCKNGRRGRGLRVGKDPEAGGADGQNKGSIGQIFDCLGDPNFFCTVTFHAKFTLAAGSGEVAVIAMYNETGRKFASATILASAEFQKYRISIEGCRDNIIIAFRVSKGSADKVQSTLCLDDFASTCTETDETNVGDDVEDLEDVKTGDIDPGIDLDCGPDVLIPFIDCNCNQINDFIEIAIGAAADEDNNWIPDECVDCLADFDGNGSVGASDLLTLLVNWGPCP